MNKQEFLMQLRTGLAGLPKEDLEERLNFYTEMIDDRIEDGLSEEEAINEIGNVDEIISQNIEGISLSKLVKEKIKPKRRLRVWEIILLVLGSPLWISFVIAAFAIVLSVYIVLWAVIICLWAAEVCIWAGAISGVLGGFGFALNGHGDTGVAIIAAGIMCAGISIFAFYGCKKSTQGAASLSKKMVLGIKKMFARREAE